MIETEVKEVTTLLQESKANEKKVAEMSKLSVKQALGKGGGRKVKAKPVACPAHVDGLTLLEARELLPACDGLKLYKDTTLHVRWEGYYPRSECPRWVTRSFQISGDKAAMAVVLTQLWAWHTVATKEQCPHDFTAFGS